MSTAPHFPGASEIILYKAKDGSAQVDVRMQDETVWLSLQQMTDLFGRDKSVISRHIRNIYKMGELEKNSVVAKIATTAADGKTYQVEYYSLDMILSVGYRVNSKSGTQFRIWATNVLRKHLIDGFTLHRRRLEEKGLQELQQAIDLVRRTSDVHQLSVSEAKGVLDVITRYMQTWVLLRQYDDAAVAQPLKLRSARYRLTYDDACSAIDTLKEHLMKTGEASELFGQERDHGLEAIIGNIVQTFDGKELYSSLEEKAAHLLYFVIKDHPFVDGNKRIGVLLFLLYLDRNHALSLGSSAFQNSTLVSLALLIAESAPRQKEVMLRMILQFLTI
jgi:DNA ligase (NAD+)